MQKEKAKNQRKFNVKAKVMLTVGVGLFLGIGLLMFNNSPVVLSDEPFCNTDAELYNTIIRNIDTWESIFPDEFEAVDGNERIFFTTDSGEKYVVHAVYWSTESKSPIFFVPIETELRRMLEVGLYGLFYTPNQELPSYGVGEILHLGNQIYCYRGEKSS